MLALLDAQAPEAERFEGALLLADFMNNMRLLRSGLVEVKEHGRR